MINVNFAMWVLLCASSIGIYSLYPESKVFVAAQDTSNQEDAAQGVLERLLPSHASSFEFAIVSQEDCGGHACFRLSNSPPTGASQISIAGTTGVELCAGLHWYLKYWCGAHISWDKTGGTQLETVPEPGNLPRLRDEGVQIQRIVKWSYYQNVVTYSYSYVWWDWERWEQEIDWMALQGINLPLAFTGQEAIWQRVFQSEKFNLSKSDLDDFFGGPAFLAWARMGNLHGWGGPLPQSWLDQQLQLQIKILNRMRALGMTPVLPGFSGNVPSALRRIYPSSKITQLGNWNTVNGDSRWCCTFLLNPTDPLFVEIGKAFVLQQIEVYGGSQHIYSCDTFNENRPPTNDPSYISTLGDAVYKAMSAGDSEAVWLMQGWLFSSDESFWKPPQMQALLHSVPVGKMLVLDLYADVRPVWQQSDQFYGIPYIWCMLHNFGGNLEMYGRLDAIASGPLQALQSPNSTMVGVGMCMEGIEQNPVVYDLMAEIAFHSGNVIVEDWIRAYSLRRYGKSAPGAEMAWKILHHTIYNCGDGVADHNGDVIVAFPDKDPSQQQALANVNNQNVQGHNPHLWYSPQDAVKALGFLLDSKDLLGKGLPYRYDLVDLTRQVLSKLGNELFNEILIAYADKKIDEVNGLGLQLVELLQDIDVLLRSNAGFLLGPWLESAKSLATTEVEKILYEWNARTQITMWFDNTQFEASPLHDYANKMWSGLMLDYYSPRVYLYITYLQRSLRENQPFSLQGWRTTWILLTNNWQKAHDIYPVKEEGDSVEIVQSLYLKYKDKIKTRTGSTESS